MVEWENIANVVEPCRVNVAELEILSADEALIFIHLMKTGGTSLFQALHRKYPEEQIFHYVPRQEGQRLADLKSLDPEHKAQLKFIHGHARFGFHQHLQQPSRYITMLREPVSRVVSLYYFIHQNPQREMPEDERCPTLEHYLEKPLKAFDNAQTRAIAGIVSSEFKAGHCTTELLDIAKKNLASFLMVGITERFDESIVILKRVLDLESVFYARTNENPKRPKVREISSENIEKIKHYNQLDLALYAYANELLDAKIHQLGQVFQDEYQQFQQENDRLNREAASWKGHLSTSLKKSQSSLHPQENAPLSTFWNTIRRTLENITNR